MKKFILFILLNFISYSMVFSQTISLDDYNRERDKLNKEITRKNDSVILLLLQIKDLNQSQLTLVKDKDDLNGLVLEKSNDISRLKEEMVTCISVTDKYNSIVKDTARIGKENRKLHEDLGKSDAKLKDAQGKGQTSDLKTQNTKLLGSVKELTILYNNEMTKVKARDAEILRLNTAVTTLPLLQQQKDKLINDTNVKFNQINTLKKQINDKDLKIAGLEKSNAAAQQTVTENAGLKEALLVDVMQAFNASKKECKLNEMTNLLRRCNTIKPYFTDKRRIDSLANSIEQFQTRCRAINACEQALGGAYNPANVTNALNNLNNSSLTGQEISDWSRLLNNYCQLTNNCWKKIQDADSVMPDFFGDALQTLLDCKNPLDSKYTFLSEELARLMGLAEKKAQKGVIKSTSKIKAVTCN